MLRHVACPADHGDLVATVDEVGVAVWSLGERRLLGGAAGLARAAVGADTVVLAGAGGVRGLDRELRERWSRADLPSVRVLRALRGGVFAGGLVLDAATGETIASWPQLTDAFGGVDLTLGVDLTGGVQVELIAAGVRRWKTRLAAYGVVDVAVGGELALAETAGAVRVFDLEGGERWRWTPPQGEHVTRVAWLPAGFLAAVLTPFSRELGAVLAVLEAGGGLVTTHEVGACLDADFLPDARGLVVVRENALELLRVPDAAPLWTFGT